MKTGNASIITKRHNISARLVNRWDKSYKNYEKNVFQHGNGLHIKSEKALFAYNIEEYKKSTSENDKLKRILGEKDEILRDLLKKNKPTFDDKI